MTIHEIGHWLNLRHVYEYPPGTDPCDPNSDLESGGDGIFDTPPMDPNNLKGCDDPTPDSCPNLPGLDPVHNYMHFLSEWVDIQWLKILGLSRKRSECLNEFTPGQVSKIHSSWRAYRAGRQAD